MTLDECKAEARRRWRYLTPFRLGIIVGESGAKLANPYRAEKPARFFAQGLEHGRETFERIKAGEPRS